MNAKKMHIINRLCTIIFTTAFFVFFIYTNAYAADVKNIKGNNRYETAVKLSQSKYDKSDYVVLVSGENFPDALCSVLVSKKYNAPILLTKKAVLEPFVKNEITRLKATKAVIVGGYGAVDSSVEENINSMGISTIRYSGQDRYDTCYKIISDVDVGDEAFIVSGQNFPDVLSVASVAYIKNAPIIIANTDGISSNLKNYIISKNFKHVYIIGGTKVIPSSVDSIPNSVRIYGKDRYDTNFKVYEKFKDSFKADGVYVASGENYPDALASAPICGMSGFPELLISNNISKEQDGFLRFNSNYKNIFLIGNAAWQSKLNPVYTKNVYTPYQLLNNLYYFMNEDSDYMRVYLKNMSLADKNYINEIREYVTDYFGCSYYISLDDGIPGSLGDSCYFKKYSNELYLNLDLNPVSVKQKRERAKLLTDKCNEIISNIIKPGMSDLDKEKAIHDYIINNTKYDYNNYLKGKVPDDSHVDYGVLINHTAVCDGYANTFKHLCTLAGINTIVVIGQSRGQGHAWNIVQINNKYYHVDVTWDDPLCDDGSDNLVYDYFNLSDEAISKDHEWKRDEYPVCQTP